MSHRQTDRQTTRLLELLRPAKNLGLRKVEEVPVPPKARVKVLIKVLIKPNILAKYISAAKSVNITFWSGTAYIDAYENAILSAILSISKYKSNHISDLISNCI